jgi:ligand-binding sensor domain-containing protein
MKRIILFSLFIVFSSTAYAQLIGDWTAYTSVRTVSDLSLDPENNIWAATTGGILFTNEEGSFTNYTTKEGLYRMDGTSIIYDASQNQVVIGYIDGVLDIIDLEEDRIFSLNDIQRNQNFTSKRVNDFEIHEELLYVATDFGIVVYNLQNLLVEDSFIQMGQFTRAIPVTDIYINNDSLYSVTTEGIGIGSLNEELSVNTSWQTFNSENSPFEENISSIGVREGFTYVSTLDENYIGTGNNWEVYTGFSGENILEFFGDDDTFGAYSNRSVFIYNSNLDSFSQTSPQGLTIQAAALEGEKIYLGSASNGVALFEEGNTQTEIIDIEGPYQNYFSGLKFHNGKLIAGSTNESARNSAIDIAKGYYIFDGENWQNYNRRTNNTLSDFGYQQAFTTTITEDYYYFGSWGRGVVRHNKETDEVHVFDETNSTLRGWVDDSDQFPVISGLQTDSEGNVWLVSRYGDTPLYYQSPGDENWVPLPKANVATSADEYVGLYIDSFDQKWITLENTSTSGNGLIVLKTGQNSENTSDDMSVKLTSGANNGNLPDDKVNAIVEDKAGEVWIGTGRGIARFIFPELIVDGGPQEREAQWLINEDTSASSRFLLRDINVTSIAVNSNNEKWIGSVNQGIWVLNAEGSRIIKRFTAQNSPLYSDNIRSIAIDEESGEVFIATDVGLISYLDVPKAPVNKMDKLKVFPNPFSYQKNDRILIEGLSENTTIKVLGVDGYVVQELQVRGGRAEWDGLNYNGNKLGTGVYFVIAYKGGSEAGVGKVVIVR